VVKGIHGADHLTAVVGAGQSQDVVRGRGGHDQAPGIITGHRRSTVWSGEAGEVVRCAAVLGRVNHRKEVLSCALSFLIGAGVVVKQWGCGKDGVELVDRGSRRTLAREK
jgi:hypothetical protein